MVAGKFLRQGRKGIRGVDRGQRRAVKRVRAGGPNQPKRPDLAVFQNFEHDGHPALLAKPRSLRDHGVPILLDGVNHARQVWPKIYPFRVGEDDRALHVEVRVQVVELGHRVPWSRYAPRGAAARGGVERLLDGIAGRPC